MYHLQPASPDDWTRAFEMALAHLPSEQRAARVQHGVQLLQAGILDPGGVLVARDGGQIIAAQVCELLQGSACLLWLPTSDDAVADALVRAALDWCRSRGCKLGQAVAQCTPHASREDDAHVEATPAPLLRAGFRQITRLGQWGRDLLDLPSLPDSHWRAEPFRPALAEKFAATLEHTYIGTLDCPELNGVRTIDEIIAGHRAQGKFRSDFWWLAFDEDRPAAVLMLAETLDGITWELAYLGVVPEFRRRGLARWLLTRALHSLCTQPATHVVLAVDERNQPARQMYQSMGFVQYDANEVFLYVF
jgi:mycothiol synthase